MRKPFGFVFLALALTIGALSIGCGTDDPPGAPESTPPHSNLTIGGGGSVQPAACPVSTMAQLEANEILVVDLLEGLENSLTQRADDATFGTDRALVLVGNAISALKHGDDADATTQLTQLRQFLAGEALRTRDVSARSWLSTVVARIDFLLNGGSEPISERIVDFTEFNAAGRAALGTDVLYKGDCFQDCLREELEECAQKLIDNIGGDAGGIIQNLIDDCIAGALAGCIATGPGCLLGALEGCLLSISADYAWQVAKFLCCTARAFASCAWDCIW